MTQVARVRVPLKGSLDLDSALTMGQTFCWRIEDEWRVGCIDGCLVRVRVDGDALFAEGYTSGSSLTELTTRYFDSERDLPAFQRELSVEPNVAGAIGRHPGLRVLRQPFWECLAYFILSSVNNIKRITKIVATLSATYGEQFEGDDFAGHAFPRPERLVDLPLDALYDCGTGFRAKGLHNAARAVADGSLNADELRRTPLPEARTRLMTLHGVGEKIADCVLLYSLDHFDAFPIDVWIRRQMERLYFNGETQKPEAIQAFAREKFGRWAGYSQMYLFHDARLQGR